MSRKTDREKAEAAKEALIEDEGWSQFSVHLCPFSIWNRTIRGITSA